MPTNPFWIYVLLPMVVLFTLFGVLVLIEESNYFRWYPLTRFDRWMGEVSRDR